MGTAVYVRTFSGEKVRRMMHAENQILFCRKVAAAHNLTIEESMIFTDNEVSGDSMPDCWGWNEDTPSRPALSSLIESIETGEIKKILVHRLDVLGTSSGVLEALRDLLQHYQVSIVMNPDQIRPSEDDFGERFARSILRECITVDSDEFHRQRNEIRDRKLREINRLSLRLKRLQTDLEEFDKKAELHF